MAPLDDRRGWTMIGFAGLPVSKLDVEGFPNGRLGSFSWLRLRAAEGCRPAGCEVALLATITLDNASRLLFPQPAKVRTG